MLVLADCLLSALEAAMGGYEVIDATGQRPAADRRFTMKEVCVDLGKLVEFAFNAVVTVGAAFAGAWFAFKFTDRDKTKETTRQQADAVNRAQFVLISNVNDLLVIKEQLIDPVRSHPGRALAMRPILQRAVSENFDGTTLSFLFETDDRELPLKILLEQRRYEAVIQILNERSRLHVELVQPRLYAAGIREGVGYDPAKIVTTLGEQLFLHIKRLTDDAIEQVDATLESTTKLTEAVRTAMKRRYPDHQILYIGKRP